MTTPQSSSPEITEAMVEAGAKAAAEAAEFCWDNCAQEQWRRDMRAGLKAALAVQCCSAGTESASDTEMYRIRDIIASHIACEDSCQKMPTGCGCALTAARAVMSGAAQASAVTDEMVRAGAIGIVQDVADHDGGPSFHELSEKYKHEALAVSRACLTAALALPSTDREPPDYGYCLCGRHRDDQCDYCVSLSSPDRGGK